jgi:hypothetical protein
MIPPNQKGPKMASAIRCHCHSRRAAWSGGGLSLRALAEYLAHPRLASQISQMTVKMIRKSSSSIVPATLHNRGPPAELGDAGS